MTEVRNSIPITMKGGAINMADILEDIFGDRSVDERELLADDVNAALNTLRVRYPVFLQAREDLLRRLSNGARDELRHTLGADSRVPHSSDIHQFAAFAITKFLRERLNSDDVDVRTVVAVPPRLNFEHGPKAYHFVTLLGFNDDDETGGKQLVAKPNRMFFIDSCSMRPEYEDQLIIGKVSAMPDYGYSHYSRKPQNGTVFNRHAQKMAKMVYKKNKGFLDEHSQFLYDAFQSPEKIKAFQFSQDLLAEALADSLRSRQRISEGVRGKLQAVLPPAFFIEGLEKVLEQRGKITGQIREKLRMMLESSEEQEEAVPASEDQSVSKND